MKDIFRGVLLTVATLIASGCVTSPIVMNKMQIQEAEQKLTQSVLLVIDSDFSSIKHQEKQLGTTFEYELGFYLKNAIYDSLNSLFEVVAQSESAEIYDKFDLIIKPKVVSFSAPVPALVLMNTKTEITLQFEVSSNSPLKPFTIDSTGTYELRNEEDEEIYRNLKSGFIYTYNVSTNFGMAVPDYSYEAGKDAYMAVYHALTDLNLQLKNRLSDS